MPAFWLLALPLFGAWFGSYARGGMDADVRDGALAGIAAADLDDAERAYAVAFFTAVPASAVCVSDDPELAQMRADWSSMCGDFRLFERISWLSWLTTGVGLVMLGVAAGAVLAARQSGAWLVAAFFTGWNVLRAGSAAQIVGQGVLGTMLSYAVTAYFFNFYVPKLIFLIGLLALFSVGAALMALFTRIDLTMPVEGRLIAESDAPELWARVREIALNAGTTPPDRIVAGIDDNFFVTEGSVVVDEARYVGRTLYVSLSLLRVLSRAEAEAVLAHEMAHFSGGDTARSRRLTPGLARASNLLHAMQDQVFGLPAFQVLGGFYDAFLLAMAKHNRDRELRADAVAAQVVSPDAMAGALVKVGAYASYRGRVERELLQAEQVHASLDLPTRVRSGFTDYAQSSSLVADLQDAHVPHPSDSHPPMIERLASLSVTLPPESFEKVVLARTDANWADAVQTAPQIEQALWADYEARFQRVHTFELAVRCTPKTPEEEALVKQHFPDRVFSAGEAEVARVTYQQLAVDGWPDALSWGDITGFSVVDPGYFQGKTLEVFVDTKKRHIKLKRLGTGPTEDLLDTVSQYYQRDRCARAYLDEQASTTADGAE